MSDPALPAPPADSDGDRLDPGLQPERTALAWRRTALAIAGLAVACVKASWGLGGDLLAVPPALVAVVAILGYAAGERRYRRTQVSLTGSGHAPLPSGRLLLGTAACVTVLAATAAAWWVTQL